MGGLHLLLILTVPGVVGSRICVQRPTLEAADTDFSEDVEFSFTDALNHPHIVFSFTDTLNHPHNVTMEDWTSGKRLGQGSYGQTKLVTLSYPVLISGKEFRNVVVKMALNSSANALEALQQEIDVYKDPCISGQDNFVTFVGSGQSEGASGKLYLVLEYDADVRELSYQKLWNPPAEHSLVILKSFLASINAVEALHACGYVHRVLKKYQNWLRNPSTGHVKIFDFGTAYKPDEKLFHTRGLVDYSGFLADAISVGKSLEMEKSSKDEVDVVFHIFDTRVSKTKDATFYAFEDPGHEDKLKYAIYLLSNIFQDQKLKKEDGYIVLGRQHAYEEEQENAFLIREKLLKAKQFIERAVQD